MKIQPVSKERLKNFSQRNYYARMFESLPTMTLSALRDALQKALEDKNAEAAKRVSDAINDAIKNPWIESADFFSIFAADLRTLS